MATVTKDDIWKVFSLIMSILVVPLAGWVWTMNVKVAELHNDLGDAERTIESLETKIRESEDNAKQIISIEKDIEYMKGALNRIENLISGS
jgi:hypothetical protein